MKKWEQSRGRMRVESRGKARTEDTDSLSEHDRSKRSVIGIRGYT